MTNEVASDFYVYIHLRADNGVPFYVGKGRGSRASSKSGRTARWWAISEEADGFDVQFVRKRMTDETSRHLETQTIGELRGRGVLIVNRYSDDIRPLVTKPRKVAMRMPVSDEIRRLDEWIAAGPIRFQRNTVVELALRRFLDANGG